jgi:hypothetical protein
MEKIVTFIVFVSVLTSASLAQSNTTLRSTPADTLVVLWTSGDAHVAEKVALMYTHAAAKNKWFENVILIVWGPSANLLANNAKLQEKVKSMITDGIKVQACIVCANMYGVTDQLKEMGIEVIGMGKPLTQYLKKGYRQLNF